MSKPSEAELEVIRKLLKQFLESIAICVKSIDLNSVSNTQADILLSAIVEAMEHAE